jgi:hypothetical protein
MDNVGPFNRSEPLPTGGTLELAKHNPTYEDIASKFFEHFLFIADAMTFPSGGCGDEQLSLWNEQDGFYYDAISWGGGHSQQLPVRSMVGLVPLYATLTLEPNVIKRFPGFKKRMDWFIENRPEISQRNIANIKSSVEETESCSHCVPRNAWYESSKRCWMKVNSCQTTVFDPCHGTTRINHSTSTSMAKIMAYSTGQAIQSPACSVVTPTGEVRSGLLSTSSLSKVCSGSINTTVKKYRLNAPWEAVT